MITDEEIEELRTHVTTLQRWGSQSGPYEAATREFAETVGLMLEDIITRLDALEGRLSTQVP